MKQSESQNALYIIHYASTENWQNCYEFMITKILRFYSFLRFVIPKFKIFRNFKSYVFTIYCEWFFCEHFNFPQHFCTDNAKLMSLPCLICDLKMACLSDHQMAPVYQQSNAMRLKITDSLQHTNSLLVRAHLIFSGN